MSEIRREKSLIYVLRMSCWDAEVKGEEMGRDVEVVGDGERDG